MSAFNFLLRISTLERELQWAQLKIQVLEERLRQQRIQMLGPRSETLSNLQLELLTEEEPGVTVDEVEAEAKREPMKQMPSRERKRHPGRQSLPAHLPRVEKVIPCAETNCPTCGTETAVIGLDESEQLDVEPARYFVLVTKREIVCYVYKAATEGDTIDRLWHRLLETFRVSLHSGRSRI